MAITNVEDIQAVARMQYGAINVYFVRSDGNDGNSGLANDAANALLTLDAAVAAASSGSDAIVIVDTCTMLADVYAYGVKIFGGGIYAYPWTLTFEECTLNGIGVNTTPILGADGFLAFAGRNIVNNCIFSSKNTITMSYLNNSIFDNCYFSVTLASATSASRVAFDLSSTSGVSNKFTNSIFYFSMGLLDVSTDDVIMFKCLNGLGYDFEGNSIGFNLNSTHTHNNKKYVFYASGTDHLILRNNNIRAAISNDHDSSSINNKLVNIFINGYKYVHLHNNAINTEPLYSDNINYDIEINDTTPVYGSNNSYDVSKIVGTINNSLPNTAGYNIDSTGGDSVDLSRAIEVILAAVVGNSTTSAVGQTSFKGRDGITEVASVVTTGDGVRTGSTIP